LVKSFVLIKPMTIFAQKACQHKR